MKLMKMKSIVLVLMLAATVASAQTNNLTSLLQQGLLEEQANRNLDAAIANYQTLATQFDKDRQLAATAVFRIGECYRMQGKTNEAAAQYQRVLHDFADQTTLATLSRQNLAGMGLAQGDNGKTVQAASEDSAEMRSLATQMAGISKMKANPTEYAQAVQAIFPDDNLKKMLENLANLQGQEAKLKANPKSSSVTLDNFCIAVNGDENQFSGFRKTMIADNSTNLLATTETELTKQNSWIADRVDFILGIQKARLKVLQSVSDSTVADANQSDNASATTDEEDQEIRRIQQMVQNSPDLINAPGSDKTTPLQRAATTGWIKVATYLFNHGAKVDNVALNNAATVGNRAMVELLLSRGADVNGTFNGLTPLHIAAQNGFQAVMEVLLANKADVNATDSSGNTPLILAAQNGNAKIVSLLLANKADVNAQNKPGETGLLRAIIANAPETVKLLLAAGANPNVGDNNGIMPLSSAAMRDSSEMMKMLLAAKADPNGGRLNAPLLVAINAKNTNAVELLLAAGAKANAKGAVNWQVDGNVSSVRFVNNPGLYPLTTPLYLATSTQQFPLVQLLLKYKADPNDSQTDNQSLLFSALGDTNILEALLDAGAKVDPVYSANNAFDQQTPLDRAVYANNAAAVEILLKHGANPNVRNPQGVTSLHYAAFNLAGSNIFQMLLDYKADPNVRTTDGLTPLAYLKRKADPNAVPASSGETRILSGQLADLLRQHGALDKLPDWDHITISRPLANFSQPIYYKVTNDWNQCRLLDAVLNFYKNYTDRSYPSSGLLFPDLARIVIVRPNHNSTNLARIEINLLNHTNGVDCSKDVPLEFGDVVEIPERNHALGDQRIGLSDSERATIANYLKGNVQLLAHGEKIEIPFPALASVSFAFSQPAALNVLLSSSDLTRVKITRHNSQTGKTQEWILDCNNQNNQGMPDFWLRDGDVIEVPEK